MSRVQLIFLLCGFLFGTLFGAAGFNYVERRRDATEASGAAASASVAQPRGPAAPSQGPPGGGAAPMIATINTLKERLQADPDDIEALTALANIYHDASMWDQAVGYYERAAAITPDDPDLLTDMGICYRNQGEPAKALATFDRAQALAPGHWQSLFNTVIVAGFDLQEYDRAESALVAMERLEQPPPRLDELREALEQRRAGAS